MTAKFRFASAALVLLTLLVAGYLAYGAFTAGPLHGLECGDEGLVGRVTGLAQSKPPALLLDAILTSRAAVKATDAAEKSCREKYVSEFGASYAARFGKKLTDAVDKVAAAYSVSAFLDLCGGSNFESAWDEECTKLAFEAGSKAQECREARVVSFFDSSKYSLDTIRMTSRDSNTGALTCTGKLTLRVPFLGVSSQGDAAYRMEQTSDQKLFLRVFVGGQVLEETVERSALAHH